MQTVRLSWFEPWKRPPYFFEAFVSMTREVQRGASLLADLLSS